MSKEKRRVPKLRFPGFTEDWEQCKLGKMCSLFTDGDWIESKDQSNEGIRLIQTGNIGVGKFIDKPENKKWISHSTFNNLRCKELLDGDILISRLPQPAGRACIVNTNNEKWITTVDCTIVRLLDQYSNKFILQSLCTYSYFHLIDSFLAGGTRQRVSRSNLSDINIMSPEKIEQDKIGLFFECIDNLITLHQRKLEHLNLKKKALLQKLFPKNGERYPELRFPGFADAWEQRKLTSFTQRVKGNDGRMDLPTLTISASEGWLNQKDRFSANIAGSEQKNYTLLRQGELSYNHGNSKLAKYGVVYVLKDYKEALVPRVYHSFKVDESYDALFVEYYFSTKRPDRELAKLVSSGARMDGLLNIGYDEFTNISISVPTFSEQRQIVALLRRFDKFITLHQRKLEHLQLQKKALLQQLFI